MSRTALVFAFSLFAFVTLGQPTPARAQCEDADVDSDGFSCRAGDCNDFDDTVFPGAMELCDGKDNNCDTVTDNPPDGDGDGVNTCQGDCADDNPQRFPGNPEVCDGVDNDCNAATLDSSITRTCYSGPPGTLNVGLCHSGTETCTAPTGWSGTCTGEYTPLPEQCDPEDRDCDGAPNNGITDVDGDGVPFCLDCDDDDPQRFPGNPEVCDGSDNDCSAATLDTSLTRTCYTGPAGTLNVGSCRAGTQQCNGTAFSGACNGETTPQTELCDAVDQDCDGSGFNGFANADNDPVAACAGDCNDSDPEIYPGRAEICDGKDNDCNAATTETSFTRTCYTGPPGTLNVGICRAGTESCTGPMGWSGVCESQMLPQMELCDALDQDCNGNAYNGFPNLDNDPLPACAGDCNDNNPMIYPGRPEICDGIDNNCDTTIDENFDNDGDGVTTCAGDCNDNNSSIYPGAPEACNRVDDDCDNLVDEIFPDNDLDGFVTCGPNPDCNDNDPQVFPGRAEICDGKDNDCDMLTDERNTSGALLRQGCYTGPPATNGVGVCHGGNRECIGGSFTGNPCVGEQTPAAQEVCDLTDDDCDGQIDEDFDRDADGFKTCGPSADCDDNDPMRFPGRAEVCDGKDNDCDGAMDEDNQGSTLGRPCYTGPNGTQGIGVCRAGMNLCMGATGFGVACVGEVVPSASETCDGLDNDCDGQSDEGFDSDRDGYTFCQGDCNDGEPTIHPGAFDVCNNRDDDCDDMIDGNLTPCYSGPTGTATVGICHPGMAPCTAGVPGTCSGEQLPETEICDGIDNDCNGVVDNGFDLDGDGVTTCAGDCNDANAFVSPVLTERCDCTDNNCNTAIDEDGFGGSVCEFGACHDFDNDGFSNCDGDCEDRSNSSFPGAPEICGDMLDNDCDGLTDEDVDEDRDGVTTCAGDCDDRFAAIHSFAAEQCDGFDNNCNGQIDEGFDQDGDFATICAGDCDDTDPLRNPFRRETCGNNIDDDCDGEVDPDIDLDGDGFTTCGGDCNDFNASVHPGALEVCDAQDNDCNNRVDEGFDQDGDRFYTCFGDCNDTNAMIHPFAGELIDGADNNCTGGIDEGQDDLDGDGFTYLCGDCNDDDPMVHPHAVDICDRRDNDCDGRVDRSPRNQASCLACNDVDLDGVTDCDGDCDDSNASVSPSALEVCDGIDNDCDGTIDLGLGTRQNLCVPTDASVSDTPSRDTGAAPSMDAGALDGGAGDTSGPTGGNLRSAPVEIGCGCDASGARKGTSDARDLGTWALVLMLGLIGLARRTRAPVAVALFGVMSMPACTSFELNPRGSDSDGGISDVTVADAAADAAPTDGAVALDADPMDARPADSGPLTEGPCRLADPDRVFLAMVPGREFALAVHQGTAATLLGGVNATALDDDARGLRGFALRSDLPPSIDPRDPLAGSRILDEILDPLFTQPIPGVIGIADRADETLKQTFSHGPRAAARTLRKIDMVNGVLPSQVRTGLLSKLAGVPLGSIEGVPAAMAETPSRSLTFAAYVEVDPVTRASNVVVALAADGAPVATRLADLTNATHLGPAGSSVDVECENKTAEALLVDFLWVVDNSASMQEEQQALSAAAGTFFGALQRTRLDFRIGVVTTDGEVLRGGSFTSDLPEFSDRVEVGINGNGRELGLEFALRAVDRAATATQAAERLRTNAVPVVIFFSDEESTNLRSLEEYVDRFAARGVLAFAIVGPRPRGCLAIGRGIARVGESYIRVAEGLGGTSASICSSDLTKPIEEILVAAAGAASQTALPGEPISGSIEVATMTSTIARDRIDGFDYEPTANSILFFGGSAPPVGTTYRVSYLKFLPFRP